jgi:hypothetical protein
LPERFLSPAVSFLSIAEEMQMALNTTSFLAGVGSVVAVLSTGLAGGYFLANPSHIDSPNRLQRVAANQDSKPAPVTADAKPEFKPEVVAAATPIAAPAPAPAALATQPAATPSEPSRTAAVQETAAPAPTARPDPDAKASGEKANADKARSAEARTAGKKRAETRKIAEQQRKQRELEVATIAVRRLIHERDPSDAVVDSDQAETPAAEMPHFNLFGQ